MSDQSTTETSTFNADQYITDNIGTSTHRDRSENREEPIYFPDARKASHIMRKRIDEVFRGFTDTNFDSVAWTGEQQMKDEYNHSIKQIPSDNTIVDTTLGIDHYLKVNRARNPTAVKQEIEAKYEEQSIPRLFLELINKYEETFSIIPHEAATLVMKHVSGSLPRLKALADRIATDKQVDIIIATKLAFKEMMPDFLLDIQAIQGMQSSSKTKMESVTMAHAHYFLGNAKLGSDTNREGSVILTTEDKEGLIEAYHIQDRPYSEIEVQFAAKILEGNSHLRSTLIAFQQMFINYSFTYLQRHPERLAQNLEPYNPIFIPIKDENGTITAIAPNPKLIKSMCNNWVPAIARQLLEESQGKKIDDIDPSSLTSEQIRNGIASAEKNAIFTSIIGEFRQVDQPNAVEWRGSFPIACPAKNMFSQAGMSLLPNIYDYLKVIQQEQK